MSHFNIPQIALQGLSSGFEGGLQRRQLADIMQRHREELLQRQQQAEEQKRQFGLGHELQERGYGLREREFGETQRRHGFQEFRETLGDYPLGTMTGEARPYPVIKGRRVAEEPRQTQQLPAGLAAIARRAGLSPEEMETVAEAQFRRTSQSRRQQLEDMLFQQSDEWARLGLEQEKLGVTRRQAGQNEDWKRVNALMQRSREAREELNKLTGPIASGGFQLDVEDPKVYAASQNYQNIQKEIGRLQPGLGAVPYELAPPQTQEPITPFEEAEKTTPFWRGVSDIAGARLPVSRGTAYGAAIGGALGAAGGPLGLAGGVIAGGAAGKFAQKQFGGLSYGREERAEGYEEFAKRTGRPLTQSGAKQPHTTAPQVRGSTVPSGPPQLSDDELRAKYPGMTDDEIAVQYMLDMLEGE